MHEPQLEVLAALEVSHLTRRFGGFTAVDDISLHVPRGAFFGFLGPNGAGKSTTIKMLTGLLAPTSGQIRVLGLDALSQGLEVKRQIGVVPENLSLFERLTGAELLYFAGRMHGLSREDVRARAGELLELMQLHERPRTLVVEYSHGMKKKLALAAALIHSPQLLFLDEPFEGVDAVASRTLRDLLERLRARGITIFLTSHVLEIVEKLCSHVAIINHGRIVADGSLQSLRDAHLGEDGASLETLFLSLVGQEARRQDGLEWLVGGAG